MGDHAGGAAGLGVARAAREADAAVSAGAEAGCRSGLIDEWLEADREAPCKQHHTAKRVWSRLVDGSQFAVDAAGQAARLAGPDARLLAVIVVSSR